MPSINMDASSSREKTESTELDEFHPSRRLYLAFISLLLMTLLVALDGTSVSIALSTIASDLDGTSTQAFWVGTAYLLTSTVFQPLYGSFSYIFGRKPMILLSLAFFAAGALLCGFAGDMTVMLAGRAVQGTGGAGLITLTEIVLADLIPLRERGTYTGVLGSMYALGGGVGPVIGGALAQAQWRWIFWLNLPIIGVATLMTLFFLPLQPLSQDLRSKLRKVDWSGSVLFIASVTSILLAITWGGILYAWNSWETILPLCLGVAALPGFVAVEARSVTDPLIPRSVISNRSSIIGYINSALQGLIGYGLIYFLPLYLQGIKEYSPLMTGVLILPFTAGIAPSAIIAGISITKTGHYRWVVLLGWLISTLGTGLLIYLQPSTSIVVFITLVMIAAAGNGLVAPALQYQIQASQPTQRMVGQALSVFSFTRSLGQTLGVAVGGALFQNTIQKKLEGYTTYAAQADQLASNAEGIVQVLEGMEASTAKTELQHAFVGALQSVWILSAALSGAALVLSGFIKAYSIDVKLESDQKLVEKERSKSSV